jgi:2-isopropylmalate synthase
MEASEVIYDWNTVDDKLRFSNQNVELCDETLRDGLQSPSIKDPVIDVKCQLLHMMDQLGITIADIGLPGAGPRAVHDVKHLARFARDQRLKIKVNCAARTVKEDIEPIAAIQDEIGIPIVAYCFLGTSPIRQYVEEWDFDRLLRTTDEALKFAIKQGLEVAFVTEDTTRSNPDVLGKLFKHAISLGARRLVLCDTVGHASPHGVKALVEWTRNLVKESGEDVKLDWHGHNDRGLGVCNALFAAEYGCDRIHGTVLGVGERVGNSAIDQLIINLALLGAINHDVTKLVDYVKLGSKALGVEIPYNYPLSGEDAFKTATGVHAAAVIKAEKKGEMLLADLVYSGVPAALFGKSQCIEIGPMSGLSNVRYWLTKRGIVASDDLVDKIFHKAKKSNHVFTEAEVYAIVNDEKASSK